jgi:hypothetical protein
LATLNDAGFPRKALYALIQAIVESYPIIGQVLSSRRPKTAQKNAFRKLSDVKAFAELTEKVVSAEAKELKKMVKVQLTPSKEIQSKREDYNQLLLEMRLQMEDDATVGGKRVRFIGGDEVDWVLEREKVILPLDFEAAEKLLRLKTSQIWNFATDSSGVKDTTECWQNILVPVFEENRTNYDDIW